MEEKRIEPGGAEALSEKIGELERQLAEEKKTSEYWSDRYYKVQKRLDALKDAIGNIIYLSE
jgi:hypothetical protein